MSATNQNNDPFDEYKDEDLLNQDIEEIERLSNSFSVDAPGNGNENNGNAFRITGIMSDNIRDNALNENERGSFLDVSSDFLDHLESGLSGDYSSNPSNAYSSFNFSSERKQFKPNSYRITKCRSLNTASSRKSKTENLCRSNPTSPYFCKHKSNRDSSEMQNFIQPPPPPPQPEAATVCPPQNLYINDSIDSINSDSFESDVVYSNDPSSYSFSSVEDSIDSSIQLVKYPPDSPPSIRIKRDECVRQNRKDKRQILYEQQQQQQQQIQQEPPPPQQQPQPPNYYYYNCDYSQTMNMNNGINPIAPPATPPILNHNLHRKVFVKAVNMNNTLIPVNTYEDNNSNQLAQQQQQQQKMELRSHDQREQQPVNYNKESIRKTPISSCHFYPIQPRPDNSLTRSDSISSINSSNININSDISIVGFVSCRCESGKCSNGNCGCLKSGRDCNRDCYCRLKGLTCENGKEKREKVMRQPRQIKCSCTKSGCKKGKCTCRKYNYPCSDNCACTCKFGL